MGTHPPIQAAPFGAGSDPFGGAVPTQPDMANDMFSLPPNPEPAAAQQNATPFDLGDLGSSLPPASTSAEPEKKTAQSFLGSAAGLVNLDNLVQKSKQPAATNPFGPSMAEMARSSQTQQMGLQQPMAPSPINTSLFGAPLMAQPFGIDANGQGQKQSNNPFL